MVKVSGGMTVSLDGFVADKNGDMSKLYPNFDEIMNESQLMKEAKEVTGAVVMGRKSYEMAEGDYTGYEYQVPLFIVTHNPPAVPAKGANGKLSLNFVTDGFESAIKQAKAAAGDKEVTIVGGADTIQQCLAAGLIDELQVGIMPVLLGDGLRLFAEGDQAPIDLEIVKVMQSPGGRTDIFYTVKK
jgi:dihydrofolate reductase